MDRIELFQNTLKAFDKEFPESHPNIVWIRDDIEALLVLETRLRQESRVSLHQDEERRIRRLVEGDPGMLSGFAVHDVNNPTLRQLLCLTENEARKMKKELLGRK